MPHSSKRQTLAATALAAILGGVGVGLPAHSASAPTAPQRPVKAVAIDPAPEAPPAPRAVRRAAAPLEDTFELHSNPSSSLTIFLDFDGHTVADTIWNEPAPDQVANGTHPAWDPDGDGPGFSDDELAMVQEIWARVAEDYAPFEVDVTTEEPGEDALRRTSAGDAAYGMRVLITPSDAVDDICGGGCGGVAIIDVFSEVEEPGHPGYFQPAWVFPQKLYDDPGAIADAASHEVGHTLALEHDGTATQAYYGGHGVWGPIMGAPYDRPVTQWSQGGYPSSWQWDYDRYRPMQDDLAIITDHLGLRADEAGPDIATATPLGDLAGGPGLIRDRGDVDVFALGTCQDDVTISAVPAEVGANLDIRLRLLDAAGDPVAEANPPVDFAGPSRASGLDATISQDLPAGTYYAEIDGVGFQTLSTGYDDYDSLGVYRLTAIGCTTPAPAQAPSAPTALTATADPATAAIDVSWAEPDDLGSSPLTGYRVSLASADGIVNADLPAGTTTYRFEGLSPDTDYTVSVVALNDAGPGPEASTTVTTLPADVTHPTAVRDLDATWDADLGRAVVSWQPPAYDGGSAIDHYVVTVDGEPIDPVDVTDPPADPVSISILHLTPGQSHVVAVHAVNGDGKAGTARTATVDVPATTPGPVGDLTATWNRTAQTADISWTPADDGGSPIDHYEVVLTGAKMPSTAQTDATSISIVKLTAGNYQVAVHAVNEAGLAGTPATASLTVPPSGGGGGGGGGTPVVPDPPAVSPACVVATQAATAATTKVAKVKAKVKKAKKARKAAKVKKLKAKLKKAKQGARSASAAQAGACG